MKNGAYQDFLNALRDFESGWDRARYETGQIQDWQLDNWAGGTVDKFYSGRASWGDLNDQEWAEMSYQSMNALGFVGYQFGEPLLIDLGYYDDDSFYGAGESTNKWDGTWTGKNGVDSLEEFMTEEAQEVAIREAFGHNLGIIVRGLAAQGKSLDDYLGTTATYTSAGQDVTVELSLSGILSAAHLSGAYGTLNLLLNGSIATDEYGTSILKYVEKYANYDTPEPSAIIAYFDSRKTGDEGIGVKDGGADQPPAGDDGGTGGTPTNGPKNDGGSADVTAKTADVAIDWQWGRTDTVTGFDPTSGTIYVGWLTADQLDVAEYSESGDFGVSFAIPSNNQVVKIQGIRLADLSPSNFTIRDGSAESEIHAMIGQGSDNDHDNDHDNDSDHGDNDGGDDGGHDHMHVQISLDSQRQVIEGFKPAMGDVIEIGSDIDANAFSIFEESGQALGKTVRIELTNGDTTTQIIFKGFGLSDLDLGNFSISNEEVLNELSAALGSVVVKPTPGDTGYSLSYDTDGSNPTEVIGTTEAGGKRYKVNANADDIEGFKHGVDEVDFGTLSVHGVILTKSKAGEMVLDFVWSDAAQIIQGSSFDQLQMSDLGIVGNEHLRQDIGGVVSWEKGVGPRESDTVYVRSHEYGKSEVIDDFDPGSMKLSFLYFGTRERLTVEDTDNGLVISTMPTGQTLTLTGVQKSMLIPGLVEFHHDQVIEDRLEEPFGFTAEDVTLVDRTMLLTPEAPAGEKTDGAQTRTGDMTGANSGDLLASNGDDHGHNHDHDDGHGHGHTHQPTPEPTARQLSDAEQLEDISPQREILAANGEGIQSFDTLSAPSVFPVIGRLPDHLPNLSASFKPVDGNPLVPQDEPFVITYHYTSDLGDRAAPFQTPQSYMPTDVMQKTMNDYFDHIENYINVRFVQVDQSNDAQFGITSRGYPTYTTAVGNGGPTNERIDPATGFFENFGASVTLSTQGDWSDERGRFVAVHEIAHALGLDHTYGPGRNFGQLNDQAFTVMGGQGDKALLLGVYDVAELQRFWGVNTESNLGNTAYTFFDTEYPTTIWDAGGVDTIDMSSRTKDAVINLQEGAGSIIDADTGERFYVALNAKIENAIGGSGNDFFQGNALDNSIDGGSGTDVLYLDGRKSEYSVEATGERALVLDGIEGRDSVQNVEYFKFSDGVATFAELTGRPEEPTVPVDPVDPVDPVEPTDPVKPDPTDTPQTITIAWAHGQTTTVSDFDPDQDKFDFGRFSARQVRVNEADGDLVFTLLQNGGRKYLIEDTQAEDLSMDNLIAPSWNPILDDNSSFINSLEALGF